MLLFSNIQTHLFETLNDLFFFARYPSAPAPAALLCDITESTVAPLFEEPPAPTSADTYRLAVALDAVHDAKGFSQVWVPCVLQGVKPTTESTSCINAKQHQTKVVNAHGCVSWVTTTQIPSRSFQRSVCLHLATYKRHFFPARGCRARQVL